MSRQPPVSKRGLRSSVSFAAITGIGAFSLVYGVALTLGLLLWNMAGPYAGSAPLWPALLSGAGIGSGVAAYLGGWRGVAGVAAFASLGAIESLADPFNASTRCGQGFLAACQGAADYAPAIAYLWLVPGLLVGTLLGVRGALRPRFQPELEAAGAMSLIGSIPYVGGIVAAYIGGVALDSSSNAVGAVVLGLFGSLLAAIAGGVLLVSRSRTPWRSGLTLAGVMLIVALPRMAHGLLLPPTTYLVFFERVLMPIVVVGLLLAPPLVAHLRRPVSIQTS